MCVESKNRTFLYPFRWARRIALDRKSPLKRGGPGPARYVLPNQTGRICHDPTRPVSPAFSFGKRLGSSIIHPWSSPRPRPLHTPKSNSHRQRGDAFLLAQEADQASGALPHPGTGGPYRPERTPVLDYKRAPKYSFGVKGTDKSTNRVPSPNTYKHQDDDWDGQPSGEEGTLLLDDLSPFLRLFRGGQSQDPGACSLPLRQERQVPKAVPLLLHAPRGTSE